MPIPETMEHRPLCIDRGHPNCAKGCTLEDACKNQCPQCLNIKWAKWILENLDGIDSIAWLEKGAQLSDLLESEDYKALKKLASEA